ncbi:site-specific integrase [bacterium]|nr:site-specific integrase [bacterium]
MGIYKNPKDEHYYIDYYVDGRRKREKISRNRKLAENVLAKRKVEIAEGRYLDVKKKPDILFDKLAGDFLELHSRVNKKRSSVIRDEVLVKNLSSYFAGKKLDRITPDMIERYKAGRMKEVAPATVNREIACLKCMFNKAIAWGKADDNPVRKVKLLKENNRRVRYLEKDEIRRLIENSAEHLKPVVVVAVFTGMRKGEILNLKWRDVDMLRGVICLHDTKNGERREVYMNDIVRRTVSGVSKHPGSEYVFCGEDGKPYRDVRRSFLSALKKSGIVDFKFHDLRHTFASQLVMSGVDLRTVMELLGHKSLDMALRYSHLSPDHKKKAIDALGNQMDTYMDT